MSNIAMLLDLAADAMGDRVAIGGRDDGLTYRALRELAVTAAPLVAAQAGGTLAFVGSNGAGAPVALFAAAWAGAAYAPLNYRLPSAQVDDLLARLNSGYVVEAADGGASWLERLRTRPTDSTTEADSTREAAAEVEYVAEPDRPAILLFTSGTSAEPKAARLDHENLLAYILGVGDFMSAEEDEAVLMVVPPFHIAGVAGLLSAVYAGRRVVPLPRFTPESWLAAARAEQVTHAFVVPTMLARIVAHLDSEGGGVQLPHLRALSYGGARMPVPLLERALELFPNAGFVNAYGLTETSSTVMLLGPEDHRLALASTEPAVRARLGSVGQPLPGIEVEIVDGDGKPVAPGVEGRIRLRGAQVSGEYVGRTGGVDAAGWLLTGDVGTIDVDGYVYVKGRADDVIIAGGENISPGEIEDSLLRHPRVSGAAVVGIPDDEWGEQVAAMVTVTDGVSGDELSAWVRADLGGLKAPKTIEFTDELPMTPTGKILRREVRATLTPR